MSDGLLSATFSAISAIDGAPSSSIVPGRDGAVVAQTLRPTPTENPITDLFRADWLGLSGLAFQRRNGTLQRSPRSAEGPASTVEVRREVTPL